MKSGPALRTAIGLLLFCALLYFAAMWLGSKAAHIKASKKIPPAPEKQTDNTMRRQD